MRGPRDARRESDGGAKDEAPLRPSTLPDTAQLPNTSTSSQAPAEPRSHLRSTLDSQHRGLTFACLAGWEHHADGKHHAPTCPLHCH